MSSRHPGTSLLFCLPEASPCLLIPTGLAHLENKPTASDRRKRDAYRPGLSGSKTGPGPWRMARVGPPREDEKTDGSSQSEMSLSQFGSLSLFLHLPGSHPTHGAELRAIYTSQLDGSPCSGPLHQLPARSCPGSAPTPGKKRWGPASVWTPAGSVLGRTGAMGAGESPDTEEQPPVPLP